MRYDQDAQAAANAKKQEAIFVGRVIRIIEQASALIRKYGLRNRGGEGPPIAHGLKPFRTSSHPRSGRPAANHRRCPNHQNDR